MDQKESDIRQNIEGTRTAMTEKIGMVEERAQETMQGIKSTVDQAMTGFKQLRGTVEGAKSTVDTLIDSAKLTVDETVERVKTTANLLDQVKQNPWIMLGSAILVGYILDCLTREPSSARDRLSERSHRDNAAVHDGHASSEVYGEGSAMPDV